MAVPNESPIDTYDANGLTTKFPVTFHFETYNTLVLKVNGVEPPTSDYYWTSDSSFNFYTAPTAGTIIEIYRNTPKKRDNDYDDNYNTFRPKTLNKDFDRIWRVIQEYLLKIDKNADGLAQEILDRIQADENMLDYIMNQDNAIKQDYIQRDEVLKNYIDQMIALITGDPSFNGIDAQFVKDESGKTQQEINNQIKTPIVVNADDTGTVDATAALNLLMNPSGKNVIQMTKGTYLTDGFVVPPNSIVYMNGAVFKRRVYSGKPVIDVPPSSVIVSAVVDGNKDALGNAGAIADSGIRLQDGAIAIFCTSNNNRSHGITARGTSTLVMSANQKALFCSASNNGFNAGASGTADGFNALNSNNALFLGCHSLNNARTGFVAETYNGNIIVEDKHDITFSTGVRFKSCVASGNGYNDYNAEMTTRPIFDDVSGNLITFRGSLRTKVSNSNVGQIYGQDADYTEINDCNIISSTRSSDLLYLTGKSPKVTQVDIGIDSSVTLSGTAATVQDSAGYNGEVIGLSVNRSFNGFNLRVSNALALRVDSASNVKMFIGRAEGSVNVTTFKQLIDKKLEVFSSAIPTQGAWNKNDIVWNTFFSATSKTMAWICTTSGVFGATNPVFEPVSIMSNAANVAQNSISLAGSATLADVITAVNSLATSDNSVKTSLKNAGIMRSS